MGRPSSPLPLIWSTGYQWLTSQWLSSLGFWPQNRLSTQWQECLGWSYFASFGVLLLPKGPHLAGKPRCSMFRGWCDKHGKGFSYYNILISWPFDSSILVYQMCWQTKPSFAKPNCTQPQGGAVWVFWPSDSSMLLQLPRLLLGASLRSSQVSLMIILQSLGSLSLRQLLLRLYFTVVKLFWILPNFYNSAMLFLMVHERSFQFSALSWSIYALERVLW